MKVVVFGGTGSVGRHVVEQGLAAGHEITVLVRDASRLGEAVSNVRVVRGDVLDFGAVREAVGGQEGVLCSLGAGRKGWVRSEGTRNILRVMEEEGVRRLVCQTTLGVGDSWGNLDFFWKRVMFGMILREAYRDHELQEKYVTGSHLDWTIVRPGAFTDGKQTGDYLHGFAPDERGISLKISRADVAGFMLEQLTNATYLRKTPGLSYRKGDAE